MGYHGNYFLLSMMKLSISIELFSWFQSTPTDFTNLSHKWEKGPWPERAHKLEWRI